MNFLIAALLVLHLSLGNVEAGEDEEIPGFLQEYAYNFSDYFYATVADYYENTTLIPTTYLYEEYLEYLEYLEPQESVGSPLQSHLPLLILLSLLTLLL